jgi:hypothetical protein
MKYAGNPEVGKICMSLVLELATLVVTMTQITSVAKRLRLMELLC